MEDLNKIREWFYEHYEELDKWFERDVINEMDAAFSLLDTLGNDIEDIENEENNI